MQVFNCFLSFSLSRERARSNIYIYKIYFSKYVKEFLGHLSNLNTINYDKFVKQTNNVNGI